MRIRSAWGCQSACKRCGRRHSAAERMPWGSNQAGTTHPRSNEMTVRTGSKTVTFHRPFHLKDVGRMLPPGDYRVVTDEEVIEGLCFHGLSPDIVIFVPTEAGCAVEMMTIDPMDLQAVHRTRRRNACRVLRVGRPTKFATRLSLPNRGNIGRPANPRNQ